MSNDEVGESMILEEDIDENYEPTEQGTPTIPNFT